MTSITSLQRFWLCSRACRTIESNTRQYGFPAKIIQRLVLDLSQILNTSAERYSLLFTSAILSFLLTAIRPTITTQYYSHHWDHSQCHIIKARCLLIRYGHGRHYVIQSNVNMTRQILQELSVGNVLYRRELNVSAN